MAEGGDGGGVVGQDGGGSEGAEGGSGLWGPGEIEALPPVVVVEDEDGGEEGEAKEGAEEQGRGAGSHPGAEAGKQLRSGRAGKAGQQQQLDQQQQVSPRRQQPGRKGKAGGAAIASPAPMAADQEHSQGVPPPGSVAKIRATKAGVGQVQGSKAQAQPALPRLPDLARYRVLGVVCHRGATPHCGHYVSNCLLPKPPLPPSSQAAGGAGGAAGTAGAAGGVAGTSAGPGATAAQGAQEWQWWRFDDSDVTAVTAARVHAEARAHGYMVFLVADPGVRV